MQLRKTAIAGTLESSDLQITMSPNPGRGIELTLKSVVQGMFGDSIRETVLSVLNDFSVEEALVAINDRGALDHVIKSRTQAVICRAAECSYDWSREDHQA